MTYRIFKVGSKAQRIDTGATGVITKIGPEYAQFRQDDPGEDLRRNDGAKRKTPTSYPIRYKYLRLSTS